MLDLQRVEALFDEVDEDAGSDSGVEARELWTVPSAALRLRLTSGEETIRKEGGGLTNRRRVCVNWDWAVDMISSPSASLRELSEVGQVGERGSERRNMLTRGRDRRT